MDGFPDVVSTCGFIDLGFSGLLYTWNNRHDSPDNIEVWLDRGLGKW